MKKNNESKEIRIFLQKEFFNSIITVLSTFEKADTTNKYGTYASSLKETMIRDSRIIKKDRIENALVCLYEDEAAVLIKLTAIYFNAIGNSDDDYFSQIKKRQ